MSVPAPQMHVNFEASALQAALRRVFLESPRRRSIHSIINKAARYVVSFALPKIPKASQQQISAALHAPDPQKGKAALAPRRIRHRTAKDGRRTTVHTVRDEWFGTVAVALAFAANYRGIREVRKHGKFKNVRVLGGKLAVAQRTTSTDIYRLVGRFANSRRASAGYHRWGLREALKAFKAGHMSEIPANIKDSRKPLGMATRAHEIGGVATATMANFVRAINTIAPDAFALAEKEVAAQFIQWLKADLAAAAAKEPAIS